MTPDSSFRPGPMEFAQRNVPWEDTANRAAWPHRQEGRSLMAALVLLGITAIIATLPLYETSQTPVGKARIDPHLDSVSPRWISQRVAETVRGYFSARTVAEKLPHVRRPATVRFFMEDYFRHNPPEPRAVRSVNVVATYESLDRAHPLLLVSAAMDTGELVPLLLELRHRTYRLDWESLVGYSPMDIEAFLQTPGGSSVWFRAHVSRSTYHNHRFDDPAESLALRLAFPGSDAFCYGYLSRNHPQFSKFVRALKGKRSVPMMITLKQESLLSGQRRQVEVARLIQEQWFIEDDSPPYAEAWARASSLRDSP